ncbi:MAG: hypothetical protein H0W88_12645 [Parachlamydiaceae bacterium]|nr:hypothetical protein [Parachlamydiaceae bacterium]
MGNVKSYKISQAIGEDQVGISGEWVATPEYIKSESDESILELNFVGGRVYLVLEGTSSLPITVDLDGKSLNEK